MIVDRLRASVRPALTHLGISVLVATLAVLMIYFVWYPTPFAEAQGVSRLVLVLIAVDVVIGPLVTLLVYVPGKKGMTFDLVVIASLQIVALLTGLESIEDGRPQYVVFAVDRFEVVGSLEIDQESQERAPASVRPGVIGPRWYAARLPEDAAARSDLMWKAMGGGSDVAQLSELYVPVEEELGAIQRRLRPLAELKKLNELSDSEWLNRLQKYGRAEGELGYLALSANSKDGAVLFDRESVEMLGIEMLQPSYRSLPSQKDDSEAADQPEGDYPVPKAG